MTKLRTGLLILAATSLFATACGKNKVNPYQNIDPQTLQEFLRMEATPFYSDEAAKASLRGMTRPIYGGYGPNESSAEK